MPPLSFEAVQQLVEQLEIGGLRAQLLGAAGLLGQLPGQDEVRDGRGDMFR